MHSYRFSQVFMVCCLLWIPIIFPTEGRANSPIDMEMQVGESIILPVQDVARVAVGNSRVLNAAVTEEEQVLLFGKSAGTSTLLYWDAAGNHFKYTIQVIAEDFKRIEQELAAFLQRIPSVRAQMVGEQLIIEGDNISEEDRHRIRLLSQRYPNIVDFTNSLGWEKMVRMDVQILEIPKHALQELGIRWNQPIGGVQAGLGWDWSSHSSVLERPGTSPISNSFPTSQLAGYVGLNALISSQIQLLMQRGDATILASPQLSARSGSIARFRAGGEVPYAVSDTNGNSNTVFKPYGVSLEITPRVDMNGIVRSLINIEVSSVDPSMATAAGPALRTRQTETEFNVASGDTLVLSGFLSREKSTETSGIPFLSDIPLIGFLFRSDRQQSIETELLILVTPHIVDAHHASNQKQVQQSNVRIQQQFGQQPTELYVTPEKVLEYRSTPLQDQFRKLP